MGHRGDAKFLDDLSAISRCLRTLAAQSYAKIGVGSTQAKFLRHISKHPKLSQADLARATQTDPGLTGRALESLIENGWVRRMRSEQDRRQYVLELSASGRRACERVEAARAALARRVLESLDGRDVDDLARIATKVQAAAAMLADAHADGK